MTTIAAQIGDTERLMASVGVGMWTWDGDNMRLNLDPVCKGFFELGWDEDTPQTVLEEKIPPEDIEKYRQAVENCKVDGEHIEKEGDTPRTDATFTEIYEAILYSRSLVKSELSVLQQLIQKKLTQEAYTTPPFPESDMREAS